MDDYVTEADKPIGKHNVKKMPIFDEAGPNGVIPIMNNYRVYYDIDAALGILSPSRFYKNILVDIIVNPSPRRIQVKSYLINYKGTDVDVKNLNYENIGYITLQGDLKLYFFIICEKRFCSKVLFEEYARKVNKGVKSYAFNVATATHKGILFKDSLKLFTKLLSDHVDEHAFFFYETYGTKKIWYGDTPSEALQKYNSILGPGIKKGFVDMCMNIVPDSGVAYITNAFLEKIGETPNYFQYLSVNCNAISRLKETYKAQNDFFSDFFILKVNCYSSLQDVISELTLRKYYPNLAKGLIFESVKSRSNVIASTMKKYDHCLKLLEDSIPKTFPYRMEFRVPCDESVALMEKVFSEMGPESVMFYGSDMIKNISTTANSILKKIKENMNIKNLENVILLETLLVSVFLRGDIFKIPFSLDCHRNIISKFLTDNPVNLTDKQIAFYQMKYRYAVGSEFIASLNDFKPAEKTSLEELIRLGNKFDDRISLYHRIIECFPSDAGVHRFVMNPIDFVEGEFKYGLERKGLLSMLCVEYNKRYDDLYTRLAARDSGYSEKLNKRVNLDHTMRRHHERQAAFERIKRYINTPQQKRWNLLEIMQLQFAKRVFSSKNGKFESTEAFNNLAFDFHLCRTSKAIENKASTLYGTTEYFVPMSLQARYDLLPNKDAEFQKDYKTVYEYDIKRLGLF